jgi:hypothetical protein
MSCRLEKEKDHSTWGFYRGWKGTYPAKSREQNRGIIIEHLHRKKLFNQNRLTKK